MRLVAVLLALAAFIAFPAHAATAAVPRFDHVVVLVEENHAESEVIGNPAAPYLTSLAQSNVELTQSYAVTHPSQPNYLALFSGSTQGITDDSCPHTFSTPELASSLAAGGFTFAGYSEGQPGAGYTGCSSGGYARKHNPWSDFPAVPASDSQPFSAFPTDYSTLPNVSFVVPNLTDDMHDGTVAQADSWAQQNLSGYITWAKTHNSLFVLTFDEDDYSAGNRIATVFAGANTTPGAYPETVNHYTVLSTIAQSFGVAAPGNAATAAPITDVWSSPVLASDTFNRTVTTGWGRADVGGSYTRSGPVANFSVAPGTGAIRLTRPGGACGMYLLGVTSTSTDLTTTISLDRRPVGKYAYVTVVGRRITSNTGYQARLNLAPDGTVRMVLLRVSAGTASQLASTLVRGLTFAAGTPLSMRAQVTGTSPTTIRARAWTGTEPAAWTLSTTDASAALQSAGSVGLVGKLDPAVTNAPVALSVSSLTVTS